MPFDGNFYTNNQDLAPTYDFYQERLKQRGTLPGSWQMRNAYSEGGNAAGSNPSSPGFTSSYSRDVNTGGRAPGTAYQAKSVSGTMRAPQGGTAYGPGSEEQTVKNFFGKMGKLKDKKDKESKEKTPKGGQPAPSGGGVDMGSQQSGNTSNNRAKAKNMNQSANTNVGGNQVISGGNTSIDGDFNMAQIGAGATALARGASLQHFMFDPNHPYFGGGGGGTPQPPASAPDAPKPTAGGPKPTPDQGTPTPPKETWKPEDRGVMDMGVPRPGQPGSNTGGMPPQYAGMGGDYDASGNLVSKPETGEPRPMPKVESPTKGGTFFAEGSGAEVSSSPTPGTGLELYRGGTPATTGAPTGAPTTGAPAGGPGAPAPTTGLPQSRTGLLDRMWNRAADRVMRGTTYGPGQEYTAQATTDYMSDTRGLPSGAPTTGLPAGGAPMGALNAGPQMTGYNRAAQSQMQAMGISPSVLRDMTYGNSANNGSPASAPVGRVTQQGGGTLGRFGGRGPVPAAAKTGRYGEDRGFMDMGIPRPGEPGSNTGGMPPQYAAMAPAQPSRHDMNPITGAVRPDFGNPSYTGPSRHPSPPARDMTGGQTGYVGVAMQGIGQADSELKRQAFRQRSRRPGT